MKEQKMSQPYELSITKNKKRKYTAIYSTKRNKIILKQN